MQPTDERPFCLDDFRPFLKTLVESEDESVLVSGLAVSAWAELFLDGLEFLRFDLPIFSKDIDLRGSKITCVTLTKTMQLDGAVLGGMAAAVRKNAPHMGRVFAASVTWRNLKTSVEVPGYDGKEDAQRLWVKIQACEAGQDLFQIPLPPDEFTLLSDALVKHLK